MANDNDRIPRRRVGEALVAEPAGGPRIIVIPDPRTPVATCNVWVRVGSNREPDAARGWAHGIEHMLFKGTERRGENDFALEVAEIGGSTNAGTGYETTNYHITAPAEHLPRAVDILADALGRSRFEPAALDSERGVLVHENHMYDDQPAGFGVTWRWALELAFDRSPYRHPIGGRDEALLGTPRETILDFYRAAYHPLNMTVVVAGDVDPDVVIPMVAEAFAPSAGDVPPPLPAPPVEPEHDGLRFRLERGDVRQVYAKVVFPAPAENDPDRAALAVAQQILADGRSCRLYREVQEERQLVSGVTLLVETGPRESLAMIDLETDVPRTSAALRAVAEILQGMKDAPPSAAELARAKIRAERAHLFAQETVQGRSSLAGWHDAMGDLAGAFTMPERIAAVRPEDVRRVCRRVFRRRNASFLLYVPRDADDDADGLPATPGDVEALLGPALDDAPGDPAPRRPADPAPTPAPPGPAGRRGGEIPFREIPLDCGARLFVRPDPGRPLFTLAVRARGGSCLEPAGAEGLAYITGQVQAKAAAGETAAELHDFVESLGASLSPLVTRDDAGLYLTGLSRNLEPLMERLGRLCREPALDELKAMADEPFTAAARELRALAYPGHPYGHPLEGTEASLPGLLPADLAAFHRRSWTAANLAVFASGDLDPDRLARLCDDALSGQPAGPAPAAPSPALPVRGEPVVRRLERDSRQSVVLTAWPGPAHPDQDRAELALLGSLLNGQSGRLFLELRNRRSLCYNSGLQVVTGFGGGLMAAYVLTDPDRADEARDVLVDVLRRVADADPPADEFERARAQVLGRMLIGRQSHASRVESCARDVLYGKGPNDTDRLLEELRGMGASAVRGTAERLLTAPPMIEIRLGPPPKGSGPEN